MRIGVVGRTASLLNSAIGMAEAGMEIAFVYTCRAEPHYSAKEEDFRLFAERFGAPFFCDQLVHERLSELQQLGADCVVSVNWLTLLRASFLSLFPLGVLNAHAGDLPRYRGNACPNWAILNDEPWVGLCIHRMTEELDAGPVMARARFPLGPDTYITEVYEWIEQSIPPLYLKTVQRLASGTAVPEQQSPEVRPLRAYPRRDDDSRIDWSKRTEEIHRLVRASAHPFPGAWTMLEAQRKVRVFRATPVSLAFDFLAVPGQICERQDGKPLIATADGMLRVDDCEVEGLSRLESLRVLSSSLRHRVL